MAPDSSVPIRYFSVLENTEQNEANVLLLCSTRLHRLSLVVGTTTSSLSFLHSDFVGFILLDLWTNGSNSESRFIGKREKMAPTSDTQRERSNGMALLHGIARAKSEL